MDPMNAAELQKLLGLFGDVAMLVGGVAVAVWVVRSTRNGKEHKADTAAGWTELLKQLQSVGSSLTLVAERLQNLPTRAEVMGDLRAHIRHDIADKAQPIVTELENVDRSIVDLASELKRRRR